MRTLYRVASEWDLGLDNLVFSTRENAKDWAKNAYSHTNFDDPFEEVYGSFITIEKVVLEE